MSFGPVSSDLQDAVNRARRHGWTIWLVSERDHAVIMERKGTYWSICITTDGMGQVVITRI